MFQENTIHQLIDFVELDKSRTLHCLLGAIRSTFDGIHSPRGGVRNGFTGLHNLLHVLYGPLHVYTRWILPIIGVTFQNCPNQSSFSYTADNLFGNNKKKCR